MKHFLLYCSQSIATRLDWWSVNIVSGNDLGPSGHTPLPISRCWPKSLSPYGVISRDDLKQINRFSFISAYSLNEWCKKKDFSDHTTLKSEDRIHYNGVIMGAMASQITSLTIVYSTVYSGADQRKHQSSASLAFVWGIHRWPMNSPHKSPATQKMFPFDDVIM